MSHLCSMCKGICFKPLDALGLELHSTLEINGMSQILESSWSKKIYYLHYSKRKDLEDSRYRCHFCALIVDALCGEKSLRWNFVNCGPEQIFLAIDQTSFQETGADLLQFTLEVWAGINTWGEMHGKVHWKESWSPDGWTKMYSPFSEGENNSTTGSPNSMRLARHWLQSCRKKHNCRPDSTEAPLLPTRVIDAGLGPEISPSLHVSKPGERNHYITLSYCWGDQKKINFLKTTSDNFTRHLQALPSPLHSTLQDAIQVTRELGFRYIWIDALCIIQNDKLDLEREISKMGHIYRDSTLTIGAGNGQDVTSGLFVNRDPFLSRPCFFTLDLEGQRFAAFIYRFPYINDIPLESRLWVVQEQILSRRMLLFCSDHIEWRCCKGRIPEQGPSAYLPSHPGFDINELQAALDQPKYGTGADFPYDAWYRAIAALSNRKATFITDQLPAIAGVASILHENFNLNDVTKYVAGLWKDDLIAGLIWGRTSLTKPTDSQSVSGYIAPTWSWAASPNASKFFPTALTLERNTGNNYRQFEQMAHITNIHLEPVNADNPFGQVKPGAHLKIVGQLKEAVTGPVDSDFFFETELEAQHQSGRGEKAGIFDISNGADDARIVGMISFDTMELRQQLPKVYCLPLLKFPDGDSTNYIPCTAICLALVKVKDVYERVGLIGLFREPRLMQVGPSTNPSWDWDINPGDIYWDDEVWNNVPESTVLIF